MRRIVLAAGGTGGHLFPAQSVGESLAQKGDNVSFITDHRGERFLHTTLPIHVMSLRRAPGLWGSARFMGTLAREIWRCVFLFRKTKPDLVVGFGSYASVPPVLAAQILGIPTLLHEQNALLGKANRYLSWGAIRVACSFEKTAVASSGKFVWAGNPLRKIFLSNTPYAELPKTPMNIVVIGGSQGSRIFSQIVPKAILQLPEDIQCDLIVTQHVRPEDIDSVKKMYAEFKGQVVIKDFFHDIHNIYNQAHIVISRAGASTLFELCAMGRPTIFVPFGRSKEGDQLRNASYLADRHACIMMREYEFNTRSLKKNLELLIQDEQLRQQLAVNIKKLAVPDADQKLIAVIDSVLRRQS